MKLYIWTQVLENYGDSENPYWKAKGGGDYFVENIAAEDTAEYVDQLNTAIDYLECDSEYFREYVRGFKIVPDDFKTPFELDQLEYSGQIDFPAKVLDI